MLALEIGAGLVAENGESASGRPRSDIATGETEVCVSRKNCVGQRVRLVIFRVNRIDRVNHRIIRREWRGDNFISADKCPGQTAVETVNKACRVSNVRPVEQRGLFHGTADFSHALKFVEVGNAAAQFMFRPRATRQKQGLPRRATGVHSVPSIVVHRRRAVLHSASRALISRFRLRGSEGAAQDIAEAPTR